MIKRLLAPVQAWILLQGKCVGCGKNLALGEKINVQDNTQRVICTCGRIFIFDKRKGRYRRALFSEV